MTAFLDGFFRPFRGFSVILNHTELLIRAIVPLLINLFLFGTGFSALWSNRVWLVELLYSYPEAGGTMVLLWYVIAVLVFGIVAMMAYFLFTPVGCLLAAPFNDRLSVRTETVIAGHVLENEPPLSVPMIFTLIKRELAKLTAMILVVGSSVLFNFLPGIGTLIAGIISIGFGSWLLALEYLDYPMGRYGYKFVEIHQAMRKNTLRCFGFGLGCMVLLFIPFLNLISIPACVVSATLLFIELKQQGVIEKRADCVNPLASSSTSDDTEAR